ncbi:hypothetical protein DD594_25800, partial [Enterobacter cloacae complex sp. 4DZ1-17B1]|uniref:hypothetical protein n=1 Tax=Enterobacter cloacae complex sp. 4DZ1-17B1 TaxID=2511991 RepID=UPI00102743D4
EWIPLGLSPRQEERKRDVMMKDPKPIKWVTELKQLRPYQVAQCVKTKYNGSGDPYAHVSLFKQVLRAEQIADFHTQYEVFGLTLEGMSLTWSQGLNRDYFINIEQLL